MSNAPEISETAKKIAKLADQREFIREFQKQQQVHQKNEDAYDAVETKYQQLFPGPKYSNYKSFYRVFLRHVKRAAKPRVEKIKALKSTSTWLRLYVRNMTMSGDISRKVAYPERNHNQI